MGAAPELPLLAGQTNKLQVRGLLVNNEYIVDRLNKKIYELQVELQRVREDLNRTRARAAQEAKDALAAEVVLFMVGILVGALATGWWVK